MASFAVSPFVLTIDKATMQTAAGSTRLGPAVARGVIDLFKRPKNIIFSVPFALVWGVNAVTYITANSIDVYNQRKAIAAS